MKKQNKILLHFLDAKESNIFRVSRDITDNKFSLLDSNLANIVSDSVLKFPNLKLSEAEDRALLVLCQILAKNSESDNQLRPDYYMGNSEIGNVVIDNKEVKTARLIITPHEFYKTYLGRKNYGSNNSKHLWETIVSLSQKQFVVSISFPNGISNKKQKFSTIRQLSPLFNLWIVNQELSRQEAVELCDAQNVPKGRRCHLLFKFNPIFTNTIRERYIEYPENIHIRIAQTPSSGKNGKVHQSVNLMRDLLFREKQQKRYKIERDEQTLIRDLSLEKEFQEGRRKRVLSRIAKALSIFIELGLIKMIDKAIGAKGQIKYRILINKDFK